MTPELLKKMQDGKRAAREKREREAAEAQAVKVAALAEEEAPQLMPTLGDAAPHAPVDEMPVSEPPVAGMADPFEQFVADLDPETRELLTDEDGSTPRLRVIFDNAEKKATDARREVAEKQAAARATRHARTNAGLISPEDAAEAVVRRRNARKVTWTVEVPRDVNGNLIDEGYRIDGVLLQHGQQVTGTYGQWVSYIEQYWRAKNHEMDFEGKGLLNEHRRLSTGALSVTYAGGRA